MTDAELEALLSRWDADPPSDEDLGAQLSGGLPAPHLPSWVQVDQSTNVDSFIFWPGSTPSRGTLGMRFLNGGEYHYHEVPRHVYLALCSARSKGINHWELVRRRNYHFTTVTKPRKNWRRTRP